MPDDGNAFNNVVMSTWTVNAIYLYLLCANVNAAGLDSAAGEADA
jgi:hypothetical protein